MKGHTGHMAKGSYERWLVLQALEEDGSLATLLIAPRVHDHAGAVRA